MKTTLSILKIVCTLLVLSVSIKFFEKTYNLIHHVIYEGKKIEVFKLSIPENWSSNYYYYYYYFSFIALVLMLYLIYLIIEFRRVIFNFSKDDVFTEENSKRLRKVGKGLIIYGLVVLCFTTILGLIIEGGSTLSSSSDSAYNSGYMFGYTLGTSISKVLPIFVVALFVQFISFIVVKGNALQEENDLTI